MGEITWAMWNCSGILPSSAAQSKMDFISSCTETNFDILILIETHHKVVEEISSLLHIYSNNSTIIQTEATVEDPYAGIVVLINNRLELIEHTTLHPGRLLNFKIKSSKKVYNVTTIYGYTGNNASQEKMKQLTDNLLANHKITDNNIILGDFNFVENDLDRTNHSRSGRNKMDNVLTKPWTAVTDMLNLSDLFQVRSHKLATYSYIYTKDKS